MTYQLRKSVSAQNKTPQFYHYNQNNSGGGFDILDEVGIGPHVWIEVYSENEADKIAEEIGIYFNGVEEDRDCLCCGDRWYSPIVSNAVEVSDEYHFNWHYTIYVHHPDGRIERIKKDS